MTLLRLDDAKKPMKLVFQLSKELEGNADRVSLTQALTLDANRPTMGLRGKHGLFASPEWWENIANGSMPLLFLSGIVERAYVAGQADFGMNNTVDIKLDNGTVRSVGIYVNEKQDAELFLPGCQVEIVYALDELKQQPAVDGGINYSKVALEMAVSTPPTP